MASIYQELGPGFVAKIDSRLLNLGVENLILTVGRLDPDQFMKFIFAVNRAHNKVSLDSDDQGHSDLQGFGVNALGYLALKALPPEATSLACLHPGKLEPKVEAEKEKALTGLFKVEKEGRQKGVCGWCGAPFEECKCGYKKGELSCPDSFRIEEVFPDGIPVYDEMSDDGV